MSTQKDVIFYGAGGMAELVLKNFDLSIGRPACFCDSNPHKWYTKIMDLEVLPLNEAISRYPDFLVCVTPCPPVDSEIIHEITQNGMVSKDQIINGYSLYQKVESRDKLLAILEPLQFQNLFSDANLDGTRLCLLGFTVMARFIVDSIGTKVYCISDNNEKLWGTEYKGIKIVSPQELQNIPGISVFITDFHSIPKLFAQMKEIDIPIYKGFLRIFAMQLNAFALKITRNWVWFENKNELLQLFYIANKLGNEDSFTEDKESKNIIFSICNLSVQSAIGMPMGDIYTPNQYFIPEILEALGPDECFVDVGAFDGDTMKDFLSRVNGKFDAIHAFEMDKDNFFLLKNAVNTLPGELHSKIKLYNCGAWEEKQTVRYFSGQSGSRIIPDGEDGAYVEAYTERLDDVLSNERVTFIKMDIEGAEISALKGAASIIKKQKPKLAIACYHRLRGDDYTGSSDLFDVPAYIKSLVPEYKILIRHHTITRECHETVCYAIPPNIL